MVITHCVIPTSFGNLTSMPPTSFFKKGNNDYNKIYCTHLKQDAIYWKKRRHKLFLEMNNEMNNVRNQNDI